MFTPRDGKHSGPRAAVPRPRGASPDPGQPLADAGDLDAYLAALAPGADDEPSELTGRFGSAQVFQLRLPALRIEQLRRIAAERGVSPGALAVDWVIDRLNREDTPTGPFGAVPDAPAADPSPARPRRLGRLRRR